MSVCAAPTCSHQSFDGSSYYVDVDVDVIFISMTTGSCYDIFIPRLTTIKWLSVEG